MTDFPKVPADLSTLPGGVLHDLLDTLARREDPPGPARRAADADLVRVHAEFLRRIIVWLNSPA